MSMKYRRLGVSNLRVSELCLGTMQWGWTADEVAAFAIMDAFVEAGGNFIDTADVYSRWAPAGGGASEKVLGAWFKASGKRVLPDQAFTFLRSKTPLVGYCADQSNPSCVCASLSDALCRAMTKVDGVEYRALVPNIKGVQRAFDAGLSKAKLTVSASEA